MLFVAHAGHWLPQLIFWVGPVAVIGVLLLIQRLRGIDPDAEPPQWDACDDDFADIKPRVSERHEQH